MEESMPTLNIPTPLRTYTQGTSIIDLHATDVGGAVKELVAEYPSLYPHLFTDEGVLRPYVNLFVNDEDVRHLQGLETELGDQDRLRIIPSIAGGNNNVLT
jgi:molybdopterin converting factor small subunit